MKKMKRYSKWESLLYLVTLLQLCVQTLCKRTLPDRDSQPSPISFGSNSLSSCQA